MRPTPSPFTFLGHIRVGQARGGVAVHAAGPTLPDTATNSLGIPGIPTNAAFNNALPLFTFTGYQQLGPSASTFAQFQNRRLADGRHSVNFTHDRHSFKAGIDYRWYQLNTVSPPNSHRFLRLH